MYATPTSSYCMYLSCSPLSLLCVQGYGNLRDNVFTTLLELYLAEIGMCQSVEDRLHKEKRALELMQRKNATYDLDHALSNS